MKRSSIIRQALAAMFALVLTAAFVTRAAATPENVDARILNHFAKTFASAENVTWKHTKDFSKASFIRNNQRMEVFYNDKDELICVTTYIGLKDLPCAALSNIQDRYEGYYCTSAIKCVDADGITHYYTQMENDKKIVVLQSDTEGYTNVYKTSRK